MQTPEQACDELHVNELETPSTVGMYINLSSSPGLVCPLPLQTLFLSFGLSPALCAVGCPHGFRIKLYTRQKCRLFS